MALNLILAGGAAANPGPLTFELTLDGVDVVDGRVLVPSAQIGATAGLPCSVPDLTVPAGAMDPHVFTFEVDATGLPDATAVLVEIREGLAPTPLVSKTVTLVAPVTPPVPTPPTPIPAPSPPAGNPPQGFWQQLMQAISNLRNPIQIGLFNQNFGGGGNNGAAGGAAGDGGRWQAFFAALPWVGLLLGFLSVIICVVGLVFALVIGGFGMLMVGISNDSASSGMHCTTETIGVVVDEEGRIIEPGTTTTECETPDLTSMTEFLDTLGWTAPPEDGSTGD